MDYYNGIPIIGSELIPESQPTIELRDNINVSPEFRKACNDWYIKMFGYKTVMYMIDGNYVANPKTIAIMKMRLDNPPNR